MLENPEPEKVKEIMIPVSLRSRKCALLSVLILIGTLVLSGFTSANIAASPTKKIFLDTAHTTRTGASLLTASDLTEPPTEEESSVEQRSETPLHMGIAAEDMLQRHVLAERAQAKAAALREAIRKAPKYTVVSGDNLSKITNCYGVPEHLPDGEHGYMLTARANNLRNPHLIQPGWKLAIMGATKRCDVEKLHWNPKRVTPKTIRRVAAPASAPQIGTDTCHDNNYGLHVTYRYSSERIHKAIAFACAQVGKPYVWGAAGPDAYDCSGLTWNALRAGGVHMPIRLNSDAQFASGLGRPVDRSNLMAGDLVFWAKGGDIYHVAMYLGNGYVVHASKRTEPIKVSRMWDYDYAGARRFIQPAPPRMTAEIVETRHSKPKAKAKSYEDMSHEELMREADIRPENFRYVEYIITEENEPWDPTLYNYSGSGAYGLCQAINPSDMASAGADWRTNPVTQLRWCRDYAYKRYGGWPQAYQFHRNNDWW